MDYRFPPAPTYELLDGPCYRCSKPRIYNERQYGHWYLRFECQVNHYCPNVVECEHYSRDPGVD